MSGILCADAAAGLKTLPQKSVQMCVTSPPYYGLRDYGADGQIGVEQSPEEYIARLTEVFAEVHRVLKDDGTLWLNIADSYAGSGKGPMTLAVEANGKNKDLYDMKSRIYEVPKKWKGVKPKDMIGIPWMLAFALREFGYYLRSDIIWHKTNCLPESVKDRPSKCYEHIFLLSKSPKYYFDYKAIREPRKRRKMKYIFDTDIGDDIDDAVALCAAVRGGLNLLGVTSVFLDTRRRCALARELLKEENSEIPVYCGRADGVVVCLDNLFPMCQYAVETLRGEDKEDDAVDFIIQSAEKYKKDLGIIAVGPLSNLAAAIERAPETMKKTGKIYLMGGFFFGTGKEWNIVCNPEAVQTVFSSGIPIVCAGLDVTEETILSESVQKKLLSGRGYVSDLSRRWYASRRGRITLHDLLVVWEALCEGSLVSEGYRVTVALTGKERGQTFAEKDENSPVRIAKGFSLTAFMNFFEREILEKSVLAF